MKIVLAHPGVSPFVQQTARAILEAGWLAGYWTTFAIKSDTRARRALIQLAALLGVDIEQELGRRTVWEVPADFLHRAPYWEILRTLLTRMRADPRLVDMIWERGILSFDRGVAKRGVKNATAIYGYEYSALASFEEAKRRGVARIYEVSSPEHDFVENLIQREIEQFPTLDDGKRRYFLSRQQRRTERRRQEWALADIVIANSTFTRDSYSAAGLNVEKVHIIPLGAPPPHQPGVTGGGGESQPLRVLWAGGFSIHKGAHYLLSAWKRLAAQKSAILDVYGAVLLPHVLMRDLPESIRIHSVIPRTQLFDRYFGADVLVFPTLCDGFGMVVTEAFSQGLPVVATARAGASELIRHGENGLIVPAGDASALANALEWCLTHRNELKSMRRAALNTATAWQWSDYRRALSRNLSEGLQAVGYAA